MEVVVLIIFSLVNLWSLSKWLWVFWFLTPSTWLTSTRVIDEPSWLILHNSRIVETNLTRHLSCGCQCQVQEHHCHNLQKYHPEECRWSDDSVYQRQSSWFRCECINLSDRTMCLKQSERVWDESSCSCQCRDQDVLCPTGMMFSEISCGCEYFDVSNTAESKPRHGRPYTKRKIKTWRLSLTWNSM